MTSPLSLQLVGTVDLTYPLSNYRKHSYSHDLVVVPFDELAHEKTQPYQLGVSKEKN